MKVFVFHPSNEFVGKFEIEDLDALEDGFEKFRSETQIRNYDYLECGDRCWTVIEASDGFILQEGRFPRSSIPLKNTEHLNFPNELLIERYRVDRKASSGAISFGGFTKIFGWILASAIIFYGVASTYSYTFVGTNHIKQIFSYLFLGTLVGAIFHFCGLLLATLGRLLRSSLDTTINLSPHLSEEEKIQALQDLQSNSEA